MKRSLAVFIAMAAFASTLALAWSGLGGVADRGRSTPSPKASASPTEASPGRPVAAPTRDLLAFADEADDLQILAPPATTATADEADQPLAEATPAPRVRLIGFVRQGGRLKAVLALDGAIEVAAVDEQRRGYRVLALDEDARQARIEPPEGGTLEVVASQ